MSLVLFSFLCSSQRSGKTAPFTHTASVKQNFSYVSDVSLKVFQSKAAHDKPEFEGTKASAEGDLPVLKHRR